jgi:hypothetical protein
MGIPPLFDTLMILAPHRFENQPQGLAVLLFWTDPVNGGVTRRL